ncbi:ATP-binding cassette domain-containing protein [Marinilactibacillus sp. GCM10026970]|uniref:ATP-binding cassette domain-containing protein n=1 Tax=Marinilactibacillus sp. GCM10026970 TaxID=3252642 RepID=UPI00361A0D97
MNNVDYSIDGRIIFHNLTFSFKENKSYTLLGPSGIGKSTLLNLLKKILLPVSGKIQYQNILDSEIVMVFQQNQLFPWSTVSNALALPLKIAKIPENKRIPKLTELSRTLDLEELLERKIPTLSGGQLQRVAIGQGLCTDPKILLLDEPTSSLDQEAKEAIQNLLLKEQQTRGHTMITVTHDIEEAVYLGQEILLISEQQLKTIDNPTLQIKDRRNSIEFYQFCIELRKQVRIL